MKHEGNLRIETEADANKYRELAEVTGDLSIHSSAKLDALKSVGGDLYINSSAKLDALKSVGGYLSINSSAKLDALKSVGGDLSIHPSAKLDATKLESVGGDLSIHPSAKLDATKLYAKGFDNFKIYDGIACVVLSTKENADIEILSCRHAKIKQGKLIGEKFFIAKKGNHTAHAEEMKTALEELAFKTGSRDVSQYKNMPKHTSKTPTEWGFVYRTITGACQLGTQHFIESKGKLKKTYTLSEILEETKGAFGHEKFQSVVAGK